MRWMLIPILVFAMGVAAQAYINGPASSRNLCAELSRYVGSESNGVRLTALTSCSVRGNHFTVTGTIN